MKRQWNKKTRKIILTILFWFLMSLIIIVASLIPLWFWLGNGHIFHTPLVIVPIVISGMAFIFSIILFSCFTYWKYIY